MNIGNIVQIVVFEPVEEENTDEQVETLPVEVPQEESLSV